MEFAFYPTKTLTKPSKFINWKDLQQAAQSPASTAKDNTACIHPSQTPAKTKKAVTDHDSMALCWADVDSGNLSIDDIVQLAARYGIDDYIVYSSASANRMKRGERQGNRWRVLCSLANAVSCDEWHYLQQAMMEIFGGGAEALKVAQIMFLPTNPDGGYYEKHVSTGTPLNAGLSSLPPEIDSLVDEFKADDKRQHETAKKATIAPRNVDKVQGGIIDLVNEAYPLESILTGLGYTNHTGARKWLHPHSTSGKAGVVLLNGRYYSHHSEATDALADGHTHDSFDLLCQWEHDGDISAAIRHYANELDTEGQKERQREYMELLTATDEFTVNSKSNEPFSLDQFALNGQSKQMREQMLNDVFILGRLALLGQSTAFFAPPNAGKTLLTLWLLLEAVKSGAIKGEDVYYINADDNYKGLTQKLELAEQHGIKMLAPGYNGFDSNSFPAYLKKMVEAKSCHEKVLILDTVKKFTNLMDKTISSGFNETVREFVSHGGSCIMLAHVNKHRNAEGKVIPAGTSDLLDDVDCAYTLDTMTTSANGIRAVKFEFEKGRGDVAMKEVYSYDANSSTGYLAKLESVALVDDKGQKAAEDRRRLELMHKKNQDAISSISELLRSGSRLKTELIQEASKNSGISKKAINKALVEHSGDDMSLFQYWTSTVGEKNAHTYKLNNFHQNSVGSDHANNRGSIPTADLFTAA